MTTVKRTDLISFAWAFTNTKIIEYYRQYFGVAIVVNTKKGPVKGFKTASSFDYQYYTFQGIPYAKPPTGDLRFKEPVPLESSDELINQQFLHGGSLACQKDMVTQRTTGNENCLHLSVYTRDVKPDKLRPVMVWIHGGAFLLGSNSKDFYNPEYLLRKDVVVIAINYRLGAFGFLSLENPEFGIPGNAGIKDQVVALKWIKENCEFFGGDPENITLFGESAGGSSVHLHMVSEMSVGLFHKAIIMSGSIFNPWSISTVKDWTQRLARALGWNGEGGEKACWELIKHTNADSIIKAQESLLTLDDHKKYILFPFGPVIEPYVSEQCIISKDPREILPQAWGKSIPLIIGACSDEGLLFYRIVLKKPDILGKLQFKYAVPFQELGLDVDSKKCEELGESIRKFYFGFSKLSVQTIMVYMMLMGDKLFLHGVHRAVVSRLKTQSAPTYLYRFSLESSYYSLVKTVFAGKHIPGACHGDDCSYLFKMAFLGSVPSRNSHEWKVIDRMCETWAQFAKTGDPNNELIAPTKWEPVQEDPIDAHTQPNSSHKCLNIAEEFTFVDVPAHDRLLFWDDLYKKCGHSLV